MRIIKILFTVFETLFYKNRNTRIFNATKKQYRDILNKHYNANQKVNGENEYINFWKTLTKHVEPYSYRLFSHFMGQVPFIIPDYIVTQIITFYLNPPRFHSFYEDKNTYSTYITNPEIFPKTYIYRIGGANIQTGTNILTPPHLKNANDCISILKNNNIHEFILKPTIDSCSGQNVILFTEQNGNYISSKGLTLTNDYLESFCDNFVLQEVIKQHPDLSKFNETSVNTLRICTYRSIRDEKINVTGALIRIGKKGEIVDNAHAGGCFVGININDGKLNSYGCDQFGYEYSSWNGIDLSEDHFIPNWLNVKQFAINVATFNKHCRLLALDITLDYFGKPRLIEINIQGFSCWLFQFCGQDVLKCEHKEVIDFCKRQMSKDRRYKIV